MAEHIKAGIFDVGGVLNHFDKDAFHAGMIAATGLRTEEEITAYKNLWPQVSTPLHTGVPPERKISDQFRELTGIDLQLPEQPSDSPLTSVFKSISKPNIESLNFVSTLKEKGFHVAIVSDSIQPHASVLEGGVIYEAFEKKLRVLSHEVGVRKPAQAIFYIALERLGMQPSEAFFTDDLSRNVQAAKDIGLHGVVFKNARQLQGDLRRVGVSV